MKTLFLQSLSGSIVLLFLLAVWIPAGKRGLYRWLDRLLRVCVAFFLLPLPLLRGICEKALVDSNIHAPWLSFLSRRRKTFIRISSKTLSVMQFEGRTVLSRALWIWLVVSGILILGASVVFFRKLYYSVKLKRAVFQKTDREEADSLQEWMEEEKQKLRLRRLPGIYLEQEGMGAFTMGIFRPDVMLPDRADPKERKLILLHELCHIRRRDVLIKTLIVAAVCLHWFNPLVYVLPVLFRKACELCCDGLVREQLAPDEREEYAHLLVKQALKTKKETILGQIAFGAEKRLTEERVIFIMKEKKEMRMVKWIAALASVATIAVAVLPVWAYEFPPVMEGDAENFQEFSNNMNYEIFFTTESERLMQVPTVKYEYQFTDEDGNVYEIDPFIEEQGDCSHSKLKQGSFQKHEKHEDGSCNLKIYSGKYCIDCGKIWLEKLTGDYYSLKCPH